MFLRGEFRAPWGVSTPPGPDIAALLEPGSHRLALLHAVLEGECTIALDSGPQVLARAGDVAVLPCGDGHLLRSAEGAACVPLAERLPPAPWRRQIPVIRGGGEVHAEPARAWTVPVLARRAGVSRSVLAERFSRAVGIAPMRYVARWRLQLAAQQLRTTDRGLAEIGAAAGYGSEEGFSRAFRRWTGLSPGTWRLRVAGPATGGAPTVPSPRAASPGSPGHRP